MSSQAMTLAVPRRRRAFFRAGWGKQLGLHALLIFISFTVLFPLVWVVSMSLDPRNISRATDVEPCVARPACLQQLRACARSLAWIARSRSSRRLRLLAFPLSSTARA